jgi:hypothetical protein
MCTACASTPSLCRPFLRFNAGRRFRDKPELIAYHDREAIYDHLYPLYRRLYYALGTKDSAPVVIGDVLPELRRIAARARQVE